MIVFQVKVDKAPIRCWPGSLVLASRTRDFCIRHRTIMLKWHHKWTRIEKYQKNLCLWQILASLRLYDIIVDCMILWMSSILFGKTQQYTSNYKINLQIESVLLRLESRKIHLWLSLYRVDMSSKIKKWINKWVTNTHKTYGKECVFNLKYYVFTDNRFYYVKGIYKSHLVFFD